VPRSYRVEAVRLELLRNFEGFIRDATVTLGWPSRVEEPFEFTLRPGLGLKGTIDRLDTGSGQRALVIDYKYSDVNRANQRIAETESGDLVQAGLYLLAAQRVFGVQPAGMLFCFVKNGVKWAGWHTSLPGVDVGEKMTADAITGMAHDAEESVIRVHAEIAAGRIAVTPRNVSKCRYCEARDICRVESMAAEKAAGA
jgi:ATP-dependent helicase/DNAse subunit B